MGDTIFLNREAEIQLVFPTHPIGFSVLPANNQYRVWDSRTGINLIAASENYDPVTLLVTEAERKHRFVLIFKKDISNNDAKLYYDYSTIKKLSQHIRETAFARPVMAEKKAVNKPADQQAGNQTAKQTTPEKLPDSSSYYYALLDEGDKNLQLKNYQEARRNFDKAHALRPKDVIPLQRLAEIKMKQAKTEKPAMNEIEKKFSDLAAEGKNKLNQKKYPEAIAAYNQALQLKPGNLYISQQLKTANDLLERENAQKEREKNKLLNDGMIVKARTEAAEKHLADQKNYDTAVKAADSFFRAGDYENAKTHYNKALLFVNSNWSKSQIDRINKILAERALQANAGAAKPELKKIVAPGIAKDSVGNPLEIKKKYAIAMANGKSSLLKNDLQNAKASYEEAMSLQPLRPEPKSQLNIVNGKIEDSIKEAEITARYERVIDVADSQVNAKAFESAVITYKQASLIKPLESYPRKQLKYMYSELAQIEKAKMEQKERQYADALTRADRAVADKRYEDAKSAYIEALNIHADNEYAKRRLEIIAYQVERQKEKEKIEKLRQDSINAIPVKKMKKRKG